MRLIIETLAEYQHLRYECIGAESVQDPNLISLDFIVRNGPIRGSLTVRGLTDMPLALKPKYETASLLYEDRETRSQIEKDLVAVSAKINRII